MIHEGRRLYEHNKLTRKEIIGYRDKKFRNLLKYAYSNCSFYREYYSQNGINYNHLDSIGVEDIPKLSKDMVRNNFWGICSFNINKTLVDKAASSGKLVLKVGKNYIVHTSGSTGKPCMFLYDRNAMNMIEANFIRLSMGGSRTVNFKDLPVRSVYIAPVGSGYACTSLAMNGLKAYHAKGIVLNASTPLDKWKDIVKKYSPNYLSGYPSCINLAAKLQKKGEINFQPKKIITGGEPLSTEMLMHFNKVFNADIIDYYGCTESILIGAGTSWYKGLYLFDDMNYCEIDEHNKLIITPLNNYAFPLIRYTLNDMVEGFSYEGYGPLPYTHIDKVMGRNEELMWFKNINGKMDFLHPLFIDDLNVEGLLQYQFEQIDEKEFIIKCVKMPYASNLTENLINNQIDEFLQKKQLSNVKYKVIFLDKINTDEKTGKTKLVIKRK